MLGGPAIECKKPPSRLLKEDLAGPLQQAFLEQAGYGLHPSRTRPDPSVPPLSLRVISGCSAQQASFPRTAHGAKQTGPQARGGAGRSSLRVHEGHGPVARYLKQCAMHVEEEYLAQCVAGIVSHRSRACSPVIAAFNGGSALHAQLASGPRSLPRHCAFLLVEPAPLHARGSLRDAIGSVSIAVGGAVRAVGEGESGDSVAAEEGAAAHLVHVLRAQQPDEHMLRSLQHSMGTCSLPHSLLLVTLSRKLPARWTHQESGMSLQLDFRVITRAHTLVDAYRSAVQLNGCYAACLVSRGAAALLQSVAVPAAVTPMSMRTFALLDDPPAGTGWEAADSGSFAELQRGLTRREQAQMEGATATRPMSLAMSEQLVGRACSADQVTALKRLTEGVFLVLGPPGTGKSSLVFHLLNTRFRAESQALIVCAGAATVGAMLQDLCHSADLSAVLLAATESGTPAAFSDSSEVDRLQLAYLVQQPRGEGDVLWPHTAFHVLAALRASQRISEEAAALLVEEEQEFAVAEAALRASEVQLAGFRGLRHVAPHIRAALLAPAGAGLYDPLPPVEQQEGESLQALLDRRAKQLQLLSTLLFVLKKLRTFQVMQERTVRVCEAASVAGLRDEWTSAVDVLRRELVTRDLLLPAGAGATAAARITAVPEVARTLLTWGALLIQLQLQKGRREQLQTALAGLSPAAAGRIGPFASRAAVLAALEAASRKLVALGMHPLLHAHNVRPWLAAVAQWGVHRRMTDWAHWDLSRIFHPGAPTPHQILIAYVWLHPSCLSTLVAAVSRTQHARPATGTSGGSAASPVAAAASADSDAEVCGSPGTGDTQDGLEAMHDSLWMPRGQLPVAKAGGEHWREVLWSRVFASLRSPVCCVPEGPAGAVAEELVRRFVAAVEGGQEVGTAMEEDAALLEWVEGQMAREDASSLRAMLTGARGDEAADNDAESAADSAALPSDLLASLAACGLSSQPTDSQDASAPPPWPQRSPDSLRSAGSSSPSPGGSNAVRPLPEAWFGAADWEAVERGDAEMRAAVAGAASGGDEVMQEALLASRLGMLDLVAFLAGSLYSIGACRTTLLQAEVLARERAQHSSEAHARLAAAQGASEASEADQEVAQAEAWLKAAGVTSLAELVDLHMRPQLEAAQVAIGGGLEVSQGPPDTLPVHHLVVDQAERVPDYLMPTLLAVQPVNLVLLGDPRQLEAPSALDAGLLLAGARGASELRHHSRSTLARLAAGGPYKDSAQYSSQLSTQFRLPGALNALCADLFYSKGYSGVLQMNAAVEAGRKQVVAHMLRQRVALAGEAAGPCAWAIVHSGSPDDMHDDHPEAGLTAADAAATGYSNADEAAVAVHVAVERFQQLTAAASVLQSRESVSQQQGQSKLWCGPSGQPAVLLLAPFQQQVDLLAGLLTAHPFVTADIQECFKVLRVDAACGLEGDAVVLSLVLAYHPPHPAAGLGSPGAEEASLALTPFSRRAPSSHDAAAAEALQAPPWVNVALSRARYHLTVVSAAGIRWKLGGDGGRVRSLWGRVLDAREGDALVGELLFQSAEEGSHRAGLPVARALRPAAQLRLVTHPAAESSVGFDDAARGVRPDSSVVLLDRRSVVGQVAALAYAAHMLLLHHLELLGWLVPEAHVVEYLQEQDLQQTGSMLPKEERLLLGRRELQRVHLQELLLALFPTWNPQLCAYALKYSDIFAPAGQLHVDAEAGQHWPLCKLLHTATSLAFTGMLPAASANAQEGWEASEAPRDADGCHVTGQMRNAVHKLLVGRLDTNELLFNEPEVAAVAQALVHPALETISLPLLPPGAGPEAPPQPPGSPMLPLQQPTLAQVLQGGVVASGAVRIFLLDDWPLLQGHWRGACSEQLLKAHLEQLLKTKATGAADKVALKTRVKHTRPGDSQWRLQPLHSALTDSAAELTRLWSTAAQPQMDAAQLHRAAAPLRYATHLLPDLASAVATAQAACGNTLKLSAAAMPFVMAEAAAASDLARQVASALLGLRREEVPEGAVRGADSWPGLRGHVVLVSGNQQWLQMLRHPRLHLTDIFGICRRPEALLAQQAAAACTSLEAAVPSEAILAAFGDLSPVAPLPELAGLRAIWVCRSSAQTLCMRMDLPRVSHVPAPPPAIQPCLLSAANAINRASQLRTTLQRSMLAHLLPPAAPQDPQAPSAGCGAAGPVPEQPEFCPAGATGPRDAASASPPPPAPAPLDQFGALYSFLPLAQGTEPGGLQGSPAGAPAVDVSAGVDADAHEIAALVGALARHVVAAQAAKKPAEVVALRHAATYLLAAYLQSLSAGVAPTDATSLWDWTLFSMSWAVVSPRL